MDYGKDFLLVDDDIVITPDGDTETVEGPACIAQDIDQELKIIPGRLFWDKKAGSSMPLLLNDTIDETVVIAELERVAIADPRVDPQTVSAEKIDAGKFRLYFTPVAALEPETLDFDLAERIKIDG